jgi:hypothetical protein
VERTATVADTEVCVAAPLAVVAKRDLHPSAAIGASLELRVGVEGHERERLARVVERLLGRYPTPANRRADWPAHAGEVRPMAGLDISNRRNRVTCRAEISLRGVFRLRWS